MKRNMISILAGAALMLLTACTDDVEMRYPPKYELPDLPVVEGIHDNGAFTNIATTRNARVSAPSTSLPKNGTR